MGEKRAYKPRKPGGGRKKLKPEYDAGKNLKEQMESAVVLYDSGINMILRKPPIFSTIFSVERA